MVKKRAALWMMLLVLTLSAVAGAQEPASAPADAPKTPDVSVMQLFIKGGIFMYPLALCSITALAIILERFLALRRNVVIPAGFVDGVRRVLADKPINRQAVIDFCQSKKSPIGRMLIAGMKRLPMGWQSAEKAIEDAGGNEALKLRKNMRFLYALGSVATLLGLIGTISGMIKAFQVAAAAGVGNVNQLSTGIYEAMVNTFGGLAVAIVVTIFYYFFVGRIEKLVAELNDALAELSDDLSFNAESPRELAAASTL